MRKYLEQKTIGEILSYAFVSLKLDYVTFLLFGLPNFVIRKLQKIQLTAAWLEKKGGGQDATLGDSYMISTGSQLQDY